MQYRVLNTAHSIQMFVVNGLSFQFLAREEKLLDAEIVEHAEFPKDLYIVLGPAVEVESQEPVVQETDDRVVHVVDNADAEETKPKRKRH